MGYMDMKASECYAKTSGLERGTHGLFNQGNGMRETKGQRAAVGSWAQKVVVSAQQVRKGIVVMKGLEGYFRVELAGLGHQWVWKELSVSVSDEINRHLHIPTTHS